MAIQAETELEGFDYVERMLEDHDRAFGVAARLMQLASNQPITDQDVEEGNRIIQALLPHVTDCDGLVLAIEVLPSEKQRAIFRARDRALAEGLSMMQWGGRRGRQPIPAGKQRRMGEEERRVTWRRSGSRTPLATGW
jgi:hypothetical protein